MQFQTPLNKFVPALQTVLKEFARKSHAANLIVVGRSPMTRSTQLLNPQDNADADESDFTIAAFIDPRFPERIDRSERVGHISYMGGEEIYIVSSRLIYNEKFRRGSIEYNTKTSKNVAKTVKTMVDFVKPFSHAEIFDFKKNDTIDLLRTWRTELHSKGSAVWNAYSSELYEEVKHLRNLGVQFKTDTFRKMADSVEERDEYVLRGKQQVDMYHVFVSDGRVALTTKTFDSYNDVVTMHGTSYFDSLEALPEDILASVSMLKILGGDEKQALKGIGFRVSDNEFFVMKPLANTTNA